jgi:hypothetical protein
MFGEVSMTTAVSRYKASPVTGEMVRMVIASEAKQSINAGATGLLRRVAPRNDGKDTGSGD